MYDAIIIGGGPAGLQAALTLGRMHRRTLLLDSGEYRNGTVEHAHNFLTLDGLPPAEIRERGLRDIAAYDTVEVRRARADAVSLVGQASDGGAFTVTIGDEELATRAVVLATGLRDQLPDIPGLVEVWGVEAANCPFCHGHEFAGRRVGLLGMGDHASAIAAMLEPVVAESIELPEVTSIERIEGGLRVQVPQAEPLELAGIFVRADFEQSAPFAEQLGLSMHASGCIEIDIFGRTSVPGIYAAGDLAHHGDLPGPMPTLAGAAAAGLMAASTCVREQAMATL
ncbi:NAD(P)/FAD-dependent oxidoreductase [Aeromicrobium sp. CF3.5]|uniref:NAD(P)/FAD-dependent oxidoreductase n=1 Tax=Aeromicrobium sp. CF3.5 TaxID=3373078 RepID=UPI003EE72F82